MQWGPGVEQTSPIIISKSEKDPSKQSQSDKEPELLTLSKLPVNLNNSPRKVNRDKNDNGGKKEQRINKDMSVHEKRRIVIVPKTGKPEKRPMSDTKPGNADGLERSVATEDCGDDFKESHGDDNIPSMSTLTTSKEELKVMQFQKT